jgi:hypothetical protein
LRERQREREGKEGKEGRREGGREEERKIKRFLQMESWDIFSIHSSTSYLLIRVVFHFYLKQFLLRKDLCHFVLSFYVPRAGDFRKDLGGLSSILPSLPSWDDTKQAAW